MKLCPILTRLRGIVALDLHEICQTGGYFTTQVLF